MTIVELARRLFEAYNAMPPNPNKTWDGKDVPPWDKLNDQVRGKWVGAALEAQKALTGVQAIALPPVPK